jgi:hypothetical protein
MSIFGMITTKGSAKYTGPALRSLLATTKFSQKDKIVVIDNDGGYQADPSIDHSRIELTQPLAEGFCSQF